MTTNTDQGKRRAPGILATIAIGIVACLLLIVGVTWAMQDRIIYGPPGGAIPAQAGWKATTLPVDGDTFTAYQKPGKPGAKTVLFLHGGGQNYIQAVMATKGFSDAGMNVIAVEYPGRGGNDGTMGVASIKASAKAALAWIVRNGVKPQDIVIYGQGVGATGAIAAAQMPHDRLLIVSGILDIPAMVATRYPSVPSWLIKDGDGEDLMADLGKLKGRITIVHSPEDQLSPFKVAQRMAKVTKTEVISIPGGHPIAFNEGLQQALAASVQR